MKNSKDFKVTKRAVVFSKGPIHLVDCDVIMPDGTVLSRQIIEHPGAAVIIPKRSDGKYTLIRQFRFAAADWLWEFPAGGIESSESPEVAAVRELQEEVGMKPNKLTPLIDFYPTPGISGEIMYLFLAEGLVESSLPGDDDEEIEVQAFDLSELKEMMHAKKIVDGKTLLALLYLERLEK